jgi:hypothetical protein
MSEDLKKLLFVYYQLTVFEDKLRQLINACDLLSPLEIPKKLFCPEKLEYFSLHLHEFAKQESSWIFIMLLTFCTPAHQVKRV